MDINNVSNEQLALIIAGLIAVIRKKYPIINGLEFVTLATFVVSLIACTVTLVNSNDVHFNTITIVKTIVRSIWITIQSVAGVSIASYLANKVNLNSNNDNGGNGGVLNASDKINDSKGQQT